jgi:hypothetical protein
MEGVFKEDSGLSFALNSVGVGHEVARNVQYTNTSLGQSMLAKPTPKGANQISDTKKELPVKCVLPHVAYYKAFVFRQEGTSVYSKRQ